MNFKRITRLIIISSIFAGSFIAGKYAMRELDPFAATLTRYVFAVAALSALILKYGKSSLKIAPKDTFKMILLGLSGVVGYHYFFFKSLMYTQSTNSAVIHATTPILTGFLAAIFLKERLTAKSYSGIFLAFAGVLILITRANYRTLTEMNFNIGELYMLVAVICASIYFLLIKSFSKKYSSFTLTYYAALCGTLMLPFTNLNNGFVSQTLHMSTHAWLSIIYMGIVASGMAYYLFNVSIFEIGPTKTASSVYSIVPIFTAVLAYRFFADKITLSLILRQVARVRLTGYPSLS